MSLEAVAGAQDMTDKLKMVFVHLFSAFKAFGEWYIGFWVMAGESIWEYLDGPAHALGMFFNNLFKMFSYYKDELSGFVKNAKSLLGLAEGGSVYAMGRASGGTIGRGGPYMVGEKGPELFVPNQSGKIVPNKALNTSATQRLMDRALGGAQTGHLGKPVPVIITGGQIGSINVGKLAARATGLDKVKMAMNRL